MLALLKDVKSNDSKSEADNAGDSYDYYHYYYHYYYIFIIIIIIIIIFIIILLLYYYYIFMPRGTLFPQGLRNYLIYLLLLVVVKLIKHHKVIIKLQSILICVYQ